MTPPSIVDYRF